ncbi:MAG: OsmC family protein [Halanaerobiales bacterium]
MITIKTKLEWEENLKFNAESGAGHNISIGGDETTTSPLELLLIGLGGCTGIDLVLILEKMKAEIEDFDIDIEAERADKHPKRFEKIHLKYYFKGKNLVEKKVEKAIDLSENKYCSASASLNAEIRSSYEIEHTD